MPLGQVNASLARTAAVAAVISTAITGIGVAFSIIKYTPTPATDLPRSAFTISYTGANLIPIQSFAIRTNGNLHSSGSELAFLKLANCDSTDTTSTGAFKCGVDVGFTLLDGDSRYVNVIGDTMTGSLIVHGTVSGSTLSGGLIEGETIQIYDGGTVISTTGIVTNDTVTVHGTISGSTIKGKTLSGTTIIANGGGVNVQTQYPTFSLYGSGTVTATGAHVAGDNYIPYNGEVTGAVCWTSTNVAVGNLTEVNVLLDGTSIFSTTLTIDDGERASTTAATALVLNDAADDFTAGQFLSFNVKTPANTPAKELDCQLTVREDKQP